MCTSGKGKLQIRRSPRSGEKEKRVSGRGRGSSLATEISRTMTNQPAPPSATYNRTPRLAAARAARQGLAALRCLTGILIASDRAWPLEAAPRARGSQRAAPFVLLPRTREHGRHAGSVRGSHRAAAPDPARIFSRAGLRGLGALCVRDEGGGVLSPPVVCHPALVLTWHGQLRYAAVGALRLLIRTRGK